MKRTFPLFALFCLLPVLLFAVQPAITKGVIYYKQVSKLTKRDARRNPLLAAVLKDGMHTNFKITFENERFAIVDGSAFQVGKVGVANLVEERELIDLNTKISRSETKLAGRVYYTESSRKNNPIVRYYKGTRKIAGYTCNRAFVQVGSDIYMVWYTPAIPFAYSPLGLRFADIKGAILGFEAEGTFCEAVRVTPAGFSATAIAPHTVAIRTTEVEINRLFNEEVKKLPGDSRTFEVK